MPRRLLHSLVAATCLFALACQDPELSRCRNRVKGPDFAAAASYCAQVFDRSGESEAGYLALRAHFDAGHDTEVFALTEALRGTAHEASAWRFAALARDRRGEAAQAERAYRRELELRRAAGEHREAAESLYGLFYLAWQGSRHRQALELASESLAEGRRARHPESQALALDGLNTVLYELGDLDNAERALEAAAELRRDADDHYRAGFLINRGLLRLERRRPRLAQSDFTHALELSSSIDEPRFFRVVRANLVEASLELGDVDAAELHLAELAKHEEERRGTTLYYTGRIAHERGRFGAAEALFEEALKEDSVAAWRWQLEYRRGLAAQERGDDSSARRAYEAAIATLEAMRAEIALDELKATLLERKRQPYEALARLEARSGRPRHLLRAVERAKARSFLDAFIRASTPAPNTSPAWTAAGERLDALAELLPAMSASPVVEPRPIDDLLRDVGERHVLAFFRAGEEVWRIALIEGQIRWRRLDASAAQIGQAVDRLWEAPSDRAAAAMLGAVLLSPDVLPAAGRALHLVTDGELGRLPFALLVHDGRRLVEDYDLVYVPSVNALAALAERRSASRGAPVVLGDPRGDLPGAALEAEAAAAALGVRPVTGDAARRDVLRQAAVARVLHLATHTGLGPRGPWIALADGEADAADVLQAGGAPALVVLAGCSSAARRGEGLWGSLGAAFLAAGSESVVAALGSIDDAAAGSFLIDFYRQGGVADPAGAVARVQRARIAGGVPAEEWMPFVVLGAPSSGSGES